MNHEAENKFLGMLVLSRFNNYFKKKCVNLVKYFFVCLFNFFFHYACVNVCNLAFSSPLLQWYKELCRFNFFFFPVKLFGTLFDVYIKM